MTAAALLTDSTGPCRAMRGMVRVRVEATSAELLPFDPDCSGRVVRHYYEAVGLPDRGGAVTGVVTFSDVIRKGVAVDEEFSIPESFELTNWPESLTLKRTAAFAWTPKASPGEYIGFSVRPTSHEDPTCELSDESSDDILFRAVDAAEPTDGPWKLTEESAAVFDTRAIEFAESNGTGCELLFSVCRTRVDLGSAFDHMRVFNSRCARAVVAIEGE